MEEFRPWVLMFKACLPIHKAIMQNFQMNMYFGPVPLNSHCLKNIFERPWRASFKALVTFSEQIEGEKSDLGFLDS